MHALPDRSRLATVRRLADAVNTDEGQQVLRLLAQLSSPARAARPPAAAANGAIGVWQPTREDGRTVYVRGTTGEPRRFWADVERIDLAPDARAVVLLGESVARGYYYDPHYNPAAALTSMMTADASTRDAAVVDLARVDCSRPLLLHLAEASLALRPAAWVVFAGNNWNPYLDLDADQRQDIAARLAEPGGWSKIRAAVEDICRAQVRAFVGHLAALSNAHGIPVVMVVPEFNLLDWRHEYGASIPMLGGADAARWHDLRQAAEDATARQAWQAAADLAARMLALDEGGAPATYEILARCRLASGDDREARALLEQARDASLSVPVRRSPRCFGVVQDALRREAAAHGLACVDLPSRFREYLGGGLPGSRVFHDYCHLTAEGIRVAAAHITAALMPLLGAVSSSWQRLYDASPDPPPAVLAGACFMSAIHNARWGQREDTIRRQCERALCHSPAIARTMEHCLDFYVRRAPSVLCRSFETLARQGSESAVNFVAMTGDPRNDKLLNRDFVEALTAVLSKTSPDAAARSRALLVSEHGVTTRAHDLLTTARSSSSCADPEFGWLQRSGVFKAYGVRSAFTFVLRAPERLACRLSWRVPGGEAATAGCDRLEIAVNGLHAGSLPCSSRWDTTTIEIEPALLRDGWNTIVLHWPRATWCADSHLRRIAASLERGDAPELFPAHGELHQFTVAACV